MKKAGKIRVGIGGWTFEPWRGTFYPKGLAQARELEYASAHLTTIEINGTFYRTQTASTFAKWAKETPDGFVFSVKGPRYAVNRRVLAEAGDPIKWFFDSGVTELADKLGPILWQFAPTKKFDAADFGKFLELLPPQLDGRKLRHVVEVRHSSFCVPQFVALLRQFNTPVVFADHHKYPAIADPIGDFVYARLQKGDDKIPTAYPPKALDTWAGCARAWAQGRVPDGLPLSDPAHAPKKAARDVFVYFIHEAKVQAPAAAMALIERVDK
jgi:uncharacterized protein YecE (DUF72 family)